MKGIRIAALVMTLFFSQASIFGMQESAVPDIAKRTVFSVDFDFPAGVKHVGGKVKESTQEAVVQATGFIKKNATVGANYVGDLAGRVAGNSHVAQATGFVKESATVGAKSVANAAEYAYDGAKEVGKYLAASSKVAAEKVKDQASRVLLAWRAGQIGQFFVDHAAEAKLAAGAGIVFIGSAFYLKHKLVKRASKVHLCCDDEVAEEELISEDFRCE